MLGLLALALWSSLGKPEGMHPRSWNRGGWHFFFLGAAFLLLEVQNISKASIVLGSTWQVNAVIISGVLWMILLANLLVSRFPRVPTGPVFATLLGSVAALYFVDLAAFGSLPVVWKASVVGLLTTLPMLFAGIVFARSFARAARKDLALGANLLGALVGALLECLSFALGVRALLLIVGCLYLLAMLTEPGRRTRLAVLARGRGPERAGAAAAVLLAVAALVARTTGGAIGSAA